MTLPNLRKLLAYWQPRLRLADWRITAEYAAPGTLRDGTAGSCEYALNLRRATIRLRPSHEDDPIEQTLLHELLHLHMAAMRVQGDLHELLVEQSIEALAWAFYELRHDPSCPPK